MNQYNYQNGLIDIKKHFLKGKITFWLFCLRVILFRKSFIDSYFFVFVFRKPHFVFYRGLLTKILGTPYENRDSWKIGAMLKNGTIYLRNIDTEESIENRRQQSNNPRQSRMASWGYNFESFLLSGLML